MTIASHLWPTRYVPEVFNPDNWEKRYDTRIVGGQARNVGSLANGLVIIQNNANAVGVETIGTLQQIIDLPTGELIIGTHTLPTGTFALELLEIGRPYRLRFLPTTQFFTLKLWEITMPLTTAVNVSVSETPASAATSTPVAAAATATQLLAANASRKFATIFNDSTDTLYVDFANTVSTADYSVKMGPGDYYELAVPYTGAIHGIWTGTNGGAKVTEFT